MAESAAVGKQIRRVLITGASGFIGGRLCEVIALTGTYTPRAFIHSTATAARITRFSIEFAIGDLRDRASVDPAVEGCDAIVHLARGEDSVMRAGLANLLRAAVRHKVSRFVHISSVAVYGNTPPPESVSEDAPPCPGDNLYGREKLRQERCILEFARGQGLPVVILRPPNVWGPYSHFSLEMIQKLRKGTLALVSNGQNPCNLVHVDNLVEAILLSLWKPEAVGQCFFVTDDPVIAWKQCLEDHATLVGAPLHIVAETDLVVPPAEKIWRESLRTAPRVLISGELRRQLRRIPVVRIVEEKLYTGFQSLPAETQRSLRSRLAGRTGSVVKPRSSSSVFVRDGLHSTQLRKIAHSSEKAHRLLGYTAPVKYDEGMALLKAWLHYARQLTT
jgi:nucleoside-diphosphate-sugar epimerase